MEIVQPTVGSRLDVLLQFHDLVLHYFIPIAMNMGNLINLLKSAFGPVVDLNNSRHWRTSWESSLQVRGSLYFFIQPSSVSIFCITLHCLTNKNTNITQHHTKKEVRVVEKSMSRLKYATTVAQSEFIHAALYIDWVIDQYFTQDQVLHFHDVSAGRFPSGLDMLSRIYKIHDKSVLLHRYDLV